MSESHEEIIVETFIPASTSGRHGLVHVRPAAHQIFPQTLNVQCNKKMLDTNVYPLGTKFRWKVRLVTKSNGSQFLGSHHSWPFSVVTDEEFARLAAEVEALRARAEERRKSPVVGFEIEVREKLLRGKLPAPTGNRSPSVTLTNVSQVQRDASVTAWVLQQANGICERCASPAPFYCPDGLPYLEVHHVRQLADGGTDTIANAVALCPNCHRESHYGESSNAMMESLYRRIARLVRE